MQQYVRSPVSSAPAASRSQVVPTTSAKAVAKPQEAKPPPIPKKNRFVEFGVAKCWYEDRTWNDFCGDGSCCCFIFISFRKVFAFALGQCFLWVPFCICDWRLFFYIHDVHAHSQVKGKKRSILPIWQSPNREYICLDRHMCTWVGIMFLWRRWNRESPSRAFRVGVVRKMHISFDLTDARFKVTITWDRHACVVFVVVGIKRVVDIKYLSMIYVSFRVCFLQL